MLKEVLYFCFSSVLLVFSVFLLVLGLLLLKRNLIDLVVLLLTPSQLVWWGIRKWEYYEDEFGSGDEKTIIHMRICQYTDITQVYDYDKKKFVNYD